MQPSLERLSEPRKAIRASKGYPSLERLSEPRKAIRASKGYRTKALSYGPHDSRVLVGAAGRRHPDGGVFCLAGGRPDCSLRGAGGATGGGGAVESHGSSGVLARRPLWRRPRRRRHRARRLRRHRPFHFRRQLTLAPPQPCAAAGGKLGSSLSPSAPAGAPAMNRLRIDPRPNWQKRVEEYGLLFHTSKGEPYW